ncbi:SAM-dependent methyltransferase [Pseudonocardia sp. TRM90224]|uniref:SAM-dependent methyltransferase n=1 Tax=Pseudonocardia sp. TRM90224 TaxID=2812678 RepID=UPI001E40FE7D|nr:SAM-dependent methyltransferase [Pseudonocardia sp. TRM90224]
MSDLAKLPEVNPDVPNAARMYDYFLGGSHNFAADRAAADKTEAVLPWVRQAVHANREFLARAVRFCLAEGVDQFLDLGSGIPTVGNVHEVARAIEPNARVAYVDNEPVTVASAAALLADDPLSTITAADMRDPQAVFNAPGVRDLLDLSRPVGLLTVAVLHFVPDDEDPWQIVRDYRADLVPGSFHALSHATADFDPEEAAATEAIYRRTANPIHSRTAGSIAQLLDGTDLVEPGLVDARLWRAPEDTDPAAQRRGFIAGIGRIREP